MGLFDILFGNNNDDIKRLHENKATILDVRSLAEWNNGHIENAIHIPLNELDNRITEIKKLNTSVITCCQSGVRSAKAAKFLNSHNIETINGGGWLKLKKKLQF